MTGDAERRARWDAARQALQARFDREQDEQRARAQFERRLREWMAALQPPVAMDVDALARLRAELAALREAAQGHDDGAALEVLDKAAERLAGWEREHHALEGAEALVVEAEQLAAGTSIDHANLPDRWQALDRAIRSPALTQRFESALIVVEQRRLAQIHVAQQQANAARQHVHGLLHAAEQALAAGQLHAARAAADEIKAVKAGVGMLPKPTVQRLSRLVQQLSELERWETFGQRQARVQLCERAEALAAQTHGRVEACARGAEIARRVEGSRRAACGRSEIGLGALRRRVREGLCAGGPAFRGNGRAAQGGAPAARGIHRRCRGACADPARRAARLARDRAVAARNRPHVARGQPRQRRARRVEEARRAAEGRARPGARRAGRSTRCGQGRAQGIDRGGHGARGQSDGPRCAVAGEGDPGPLAGERQGDAARAARRARAVGRAARGVRRRVRGAPRQAQGRGRPPAVRPARAGGNLRTARAAGAAVRTATSRTIRRALREVQEQWKQRVGRSDRAARTRIAVPQCRARGGDDAVGARPLARGRRVADPRGERAAVRRARSPRGLERRGGGRGEPGVVDNRTLGRVAGDCRGLGEEAPRPPRCRAACAGGPCRGG